MASRSASPAPPFPTSKQPAPVQPNAHPYAIKTTSTALLSRSTSSPHTVHPPKHHYVPPSPTRQRHRHSSSLSSVEGFSVNETAHPSPLPTPPSFSVTRPSFPVSNVSTPPRRTRAETLPTCSATPMVGASGNAILDGDLPSNPKYWSTDQLATYLTTSLRKTGELDPQSVEEVLDYIHGRCITGRELLRLTDFDLVSAQLSDVQKARLLENSRSLRADVLRGRIWVDPTHSKGIPNDSTDVFLRSTHSVRSSPFHNDLYRTSISSVDLLLPRSSPFDLELPPSPTSSLHRSDASAQRHKDLARIRARRRGKVKGLVEAWERERGRDSISGSDSSTNEGSVSDSDVESESDTDEGMDATQEEQMPSPAESSSPMADSTIMLSHPPLHNLITVDDEEEPSIEELLASSIPLQGARAWEADFALGETVKRIPVDPVSSDGTTLQSGGSSITNSAAERGSSIKSNGTSERVDATGVTASTRRRNAMQKRVVTAIFTGSTHDQGAKPSDEKLDRDHAVNTSLQDFLGITGVDNVESMSVPLVPRDDSSQIHAADELDDIMHALQFSIESTRAQLETFRVRLEAVEFDIARHDAELSAEPQPAHPTKSLQDGKEGRTDVPTEDISQANENMYPSVQDALVFNFDVRGIARSVLATAMGWIYPYSHPGLHPRPQRSRSASRSPVRRRPLPAFRISYVILFSFALCAAVLRRSGFGRWLRGT